MTETPVQKPSANTVRRSELLWNISITILFFTGVLLAVSRTNADPDLWGHLRFGLDTLDNQAVVQVDPYSYLTVGQRWFNHEWLAEVTFALVWNLAGSTGLVLMKTFTWLLTIGLIYRYLMRLPLPPLRAAILLGLAMPLLMPISITVRPHMYTALFFTILLLVIIKADGGRYRWLWAAPPIFVLWPNIHGAFLIGLGILCFWGLLHILTHRQKSVLINIAPPLFASLLATLINPYGADLWLFLISHLQDPRLEITEWRPLTVHALLGWIYIGWLVLAALGLYFTRKKRSLALVILFVFLGYLPLVSERHLLFFCIGAVLLTAPHIGDAWDRFMPAPKTARYRNLALIALPVLAALVIAVLISPKFYRIPISERQAYPVAAVRLLNDSEVSGNLALHFDWGDYVIWHLTPQIKVSIDTRREMAYPENIYHTNIRFMTGIGNWDELLDQYPTDMVLVRKDTANDNLIKLRGDWELVFEDSVSALYVKEGSLPAKRLENINTAPLTGLTDPYFP